MTQEAHSPSEGVADGQATTEASAPVPTLALKQAREMVGLHVAVLATLLKVPVKRLEALEAGRYDELPDATFARALALSVCRQLKIDPAPILASLPQSATVRLGEEQGSLGTPFQSGNETGKTGLSGAPRHLSRSAVFAVLVLVVTLVLWWWLPGQMARQAELSVPAREAAVAVVEPVSAEAPSENVGGGVSPVSEPEPEASVDSAKTAAAPVETEQPVAGETLRLQASQTVWVEVTGGTGRLLIQRNLQEGEMVSLSSPPPFAVVLGRADAVEVFFRGRRVDVAPHARNNVARFEVK